MGGGDLCQFMREVENQISKDALWTIVLEYPRSNVVDKTVNVGVEAWDSTHPCNTRTELNAIT